MKNNAKPTACCPACQRFEVLDRVWFANLPAICASCADAQVGYGPVCAEKFGLPWGAVPKEVA